MLPGSAAAPAGRFLRPPSCAMTTVVQGQCTLCVPATVSATGGSGMLWPPPASRSARPAGTPPRYQASHLDPRSAYRYYSEAPAISTPASDCALIRRGDQHGEASACLKRQAAEYSASRDVRGPDIAPLAGPVIPPGANSPRHPLGARTPLPPALPGGERRPFRGRCSGRESPRGESLRRAPGRAEGQPGTTQPGHAGEFPVQYMRAPRSPLHASAAWLPRLSRSPGTPYQGLHGSAPARPAAAAPRLATVGVRTRPRPARSDDPPVTP